MYRKNGVLTAKIVPTDWAGQSVGRSGLGQFSVKPKNRKEFHQVLDFQRFAFLRYPLRWLYGGFTVTVKPLIFNALQTSLKRLSFNAFTHLYGCKNRAN
jgi:hypothetical protein